MKRPFASVALRAEDVEVKREMFVAKIAIGDPFDCWEWTASRTHQGYGRFTVPATGCTTAQRISYALFVGDLEPGLTIDHLCKNTGCVNPWHLEAVPHIVNIRRGDGICQQHARRTHCIRGHELAFYNGPNNQQRYCPICKRNNGREWQRKYRAAQRERQAA